MEEFSSFPLTKSSFFLCAAALPSVFSFPPLAPVKSSWHVTDKVFSKSAPPFWRRRESGHSVCCPRPLPLFLFERDRAFFFSSRKLWRTGSSAHVTLCISPLSRVSRSRLLDFFEYSGGSTPLSSPSVTPGTHLQSMRSLFRQESRNARLLS